MSEFQIGYTVGVLSVPAVYYLGYLVGYFLPPYHERKTGRQIPAPPTGSGVGTPQRRLPTGGTGRRTNSIHSGVSHALPKRP